MEQWTWTKWSAVLGFALGGFFDGILLHQILQWHHLLSLVPGLDDLRLQVLWDGYFHALMYVIAVIGLWGLWRAHRTSQAGGSAQLGGALLIGFGLWHVLDSILSHWLLGIHRIKIDGESPLAWDLLWFSVFGIVPLLGSWLILRRGGPGIGTFRGSAVSIFFVGALAAAMGMWALQPPSAQPFTTVVFRPDMGQQEVVSALAATDARLVWSDSLMGVVVISVAPERRWDFYRHGALLVTGSGLLADCFDRSF